MATFLVDAEGQIILTIPLPAEDYATVRIGGMDGEPFVPGAIIEIDGERLAGVLDKLLAPLRLQAIAIQTDER